VGLAVGGIGYQHQLANLRANPPELLIATPGRLTALCGKSAHKNPQKKQTKLDTHNGADVDDKDKDTKTETADRCITFEHVHDFVLDEADLMLSRGFHDELTWLAQVLQMESVDGFRVVLTSATWDAATSTQAVAQFASRSDVAPVVVRADDSGNGRTKNETTMTGRRSPHQDGGLMVSTTVTQQVEVVWQKGAPRFKRLCTLLEAALRQTSFRHGNGQQTTIDAEESSRNDDDDRTRIIVFCLQKAQARQIGNALKQQKTGLRVAATTILILEGDMSQAARAAAVDTFRRGGSSGGGVVLVATDVAARGLDCHVAHVVNYSVGLSLAGYVHRCGRTGRAGRYGISTTFVVKGIDDHLTPELVRLLRHAQQRVVDDLRILATKELQRRRQLQQQRQGGGPGGPGGPTTNPGSQNRNNNDDEEDIAEVRRANREKQLRLNQQRQRSAKQQQKRRGKR